MNRNDPNDHTNRVWDWWNDQRRYEDIPEAYAKFALQVIEDHFKSRNELIPWTLIHPLDMLLEDWEVKNFATIEALYEEAHDTSGDQLERSIYELRQAQR